MAYVRETASGITAEGRSEKTVQAGDLSPEAAASSAKERNERAVELGITARYEVAGT